MNQKVIRFRRTSLKTKYHLYEIVVCFRYKRHRGPYIEKLGYYNSGIKDKAIFFNSRRFVYWLTKGAVINSNIKKHLVKFIIKKNEIFFKNMSK